MRTGRRGWAAALAVLAVAVASMLAAAAASAHRVVIGPPNSSTYSKAIRDTLAATFFNVSLAEPGAFATSPTDGVIYNVNIAGAQGGPYRLQVLHPLGGDLYLGGGTSNPLYFEPPETSYLKPLPIDKGDAVGLDLEPGLSLAFAEPPGGSTANWVPPLAGEESRPHGPARSPREFGFNVDVLPPPTVTAVRPHSMDVHRPRRVTVVGENFALVRAVYFGDRKATVFRIEPPHRIVIFPPQSGSPRRTRVTVQTEAGTSPRTAASRFAYTGSKHR
jgi:IPT/TIG domain-containing protein